MHEYNSLLTVNHCISVETFLTSKNYVYVNSAMRFVNSV